MSQRNGGAPSWETYERGLASSFGSLDSVPENSQSGVEDGEDGHGSGLRKRPSLAALRFNQIRQMGGPNSIDNFAKSWQRAATFRQITPVRRNSITVAGTEDEEGGGNRVFRASPSQERSLLRQQFEAAGNLGANTSAVHDSPGEQSDPTERTALLTPHQQEIASALSIGPSGPGSIAGSITAHSYGSISRRLTPTAQRRASVLIMEQRDASLRALAAAGDDDKARVDELKHHIEQEVRPDGEVIERIVGESTLPMTIFNSTNVMIGVGILALPLAVRYAGWIIGVAFLSFAAVVSAYTAVLLSKCLDTNSGATTYGDIAFLAFGNHGRNFVDVIFILELTAANVALVILFGDSMNSLVPSLSPLAWKSVLALGLIPLNFAPFKLLSITSVLGIISCLGIVVIVLVDGLLKPDYPGSLLHVAKTYAFPENWLALPLSFGLFMAPWGGHSVFPAVYTDMRHPYKYKRALGYTYVFTYGLDMSMAVLGYLMFGDLVQEEITGNLLSCKDYPVPLAVLTVVLISIVPITKMGLTNRPMMDTVNKKLQIDLRQMDPEARAKSEVSLSHRLMRFAVGASVNIVQLAVAIVFPSFDSVMALMGSAMCFTICFILPISFHLKIFSKEADAISLTERIINWILMFVSTILAVLGTVFALLPKESLGLR